MTLVGSGGALLFARSPASVTSRLAIQCERSNRAKQLQCFFLLADPGVHERESISR